MNVAVAIDETQGRDAASEREADASARRCIVTRESAPRTGLLRLVLGPDGVVVPDLAENLPGRGAWVSADRTALATAVAKSMFGHAFRQAAKAPADLPDRVERLLVERCIALIGFARRAGGVVFGYERVRAAVAAGEVALLLTASDSEGRDAAELASRYRGERFAVLTADEIGAALGRAGIVHLGLKPGRLAAALARELQRLAGFRAGASEAGAVRQGRHQRPKE
ncbi:MAG: RNA-binding protein [Rhodospirillaceae bacterium]|nr:RNA-binding protein [Rhodospirillaceae bacterium]